MNENDNFNGPKPFNYDQMADAIAKRLNGDSDETKTLHIRLAGHKETIAERDRQLRILQANYDKVREEQKEQARNILDMIAKSDALFAVNSELRHENYILNAQLRDLRTAAKQEAQCNDEVNEDVANLIGELSEADTYNFKLTARLERASDALGTLITNAQHIQSFVNSALVENGEDLPQSSEGHTGKDMDDGVCPAHFAFYPLQANILAEALDFAVRHNFLVEVRDDLKA